MPSFACTIGIDYSGARTPTASLNCFAVARSAYCTTASILSARARGRAPTASQILGTPSRNEPRTVRRAQGKVQQARELLAPVCGIGVH